jgi:hypothetical protein
MRTTSRLQFIAYVEDTISAYLFYFDRVTLGIQGDNFSTNRTYHFQISMWGSFNLQSVQERTHSQI